ncbi:hypothetical protein COCC4DRAFT_142424 [Bipolaris maydis ATCC 48331]|uniref:Enoyl reductase (ER) domain-containing protein n=2 Tax=Cochliobolus heterostrophus TaxID=5016 RepID=M2UDY6_COCH5|nr:uncharacterized protein COCC4DRAFT_142424 [Bipolaris maydis ATCC 48331]EMD96769.1 hypothetical protein COCHEDRAFT_1162782 [Bipolaris maydis C5]KAH7558263.1 hypothetical protein BM1_05535 [Bipolaris maydis]ENI03636.1 hypothetical protein COCC4DRAFT_142424 [Bipolaris maydis ATCC 48331]KAJ5031348.1 chaperonin 10-like protein [Bipolaris maydis]KAJ5060602.1 chaperonin 10-like protein [Bipolaris maydis]
MMPPYSIPSTMRAAVIEEFKKPYRFREIPTPTEPTGHDLLIKVLAASYCHTDAVLVEGKMSQDLPRIGCHEFAGRVVAAGPDVSKSLNIAIGDEVGVPGRAYHPCGVCDECTLDHGDPVGYSPYCLKAKNLGLTMNGGFCEYALVDSQQVAPIPEDMTALEAAPLMCAGLTIWSALERVKEANTIAIIGAGGGLGHLGVQFAAHLGKRTLAVDRGDKPLNLLKSVVDQMGSSTPGSTVLVDSLVRDPKDVVQDVTDGGVEAVIFLPESQAAFDYGIQLLRNHGTMVVVSFPDELKFSAKDLVFRDIKVIGSLVGRNHQLRQMLNFAAKNRIKAATKLYTLEDLNELVNQHRVGVGGKLVIDMDQKGKSEKSLT